MSVVLALRSDRAMGWLEWHSAAAASETRSALLMPRGSTPITEKLPSVTVPVLSMTSVAEAESFSSSDLLRMTMPCPTAVLRPAKYAMDDAMSGVVSEAEARNISPLCVQTSQSSVMIEGMTASATARSVITGVNSLETRAKRASRFETLFGACSTISAVRRSVELLYSPVTRIFSELPRFTQPETTSFPTPTSIGTLSPV